MRKAAVVVSHRDLFVSMATRRSVVAPRPFAVGIPRQDQLHARRHGTTTRTAFTARTTTATTTPTSMRATCAAMPAPRLAAAGLRLLSGTCQRRGPRGSGHADGEGRGAAKGLDDAWHLWANTPSGSVRGPSVFAVGMRPRWVKKNDPLQRCAAKHVPSHGSNDSYVND